MKNLLLLVALGLITSLNAQGTWPTTKDNEFKWEEKDQGKIHDVRFVLVDSDSIDQTSLELIVMRSMIAAKYELKNPYSFKPLELCIITKTTGKISAIVKYLGKNSYGVESVLNTYLNVIKGNNVEVLMTL